MSAKTAGLGFYPNGGDAGHFSAFCVALGAGKIFCGANPPARKNLAAYYCENAEAGTFMRKIFADSDADFVEIKPKHPYPEDCGERMRRYLRKIKSGFLPEICDPPKGIRAYENVYLLCPTCLGFIPPPIRSFLCMYDFSGKTLRLFCLCAPKRPSNLALSACGLCPGARVEIFCARERGGAAACPFSMRAGF